MTRFFGLNRLQKQFAFQDAVKDPNPEAVTPVESQENLSVCAVFQ